MRCLVKDIRGDEHKKRLKKVKTVDKSRSPVIFSEFDPDSGSGGLHSRERRDGAGEERVAALPWQGILRKAHRAGMNTN